MMRLLPIFLLFIVLIYIWLKKYELNQRIRRWKRALMLDQHQPVFGNIYAAVNGFELSREARKRGDAIELVYGEIEFESFIALLTLCKPHSNTIFYDLGSGTGKAVLACAMVFKVRESYGIELLASLHLCANRQQQQLATITGYQNLAQTIHFLHGDFFEFDISNASLVFINSSAFFSGYWEKTSHHLEQLSPGTTVISTSKPIASCQFIVLQIIPVQMSWGVVNAFIQKRLQNAAKSRG